MPGALHETCSGECAGAPASIRVMVRAILPYTVRFLFPVEEGDGSQERFNVDALRHVRKACAPSLAAAASPPTRPRIPCPPCPCAEGHPAAESRVEVLLLVPRDYSRRRGIISKVLFSAPRD